MTEVIVNALRKNGPLRCYDWSQGKQLSGLALKVARFRGAMASIAKVLLGGKQKAELLYYPMNAGWGQLYDLATILIAKLRGYELALHHHSYAYIDRYDWRTGLVNRLLRKTDAHIVHCELMQQDFLRQYSSQARFLFVPPTIVSDQQPVAPKSSTERFTLGFMSNLTLAKGLKEVLETFERLTNSGQDVALILAGPCKGSAERSLVDQALAKWPSRIEYRGPVYDQAKAHFFADISVFLFPTKSESWGIVLTESLSASCPVIAYSRGCIPWIMKDGCGLTVQPDQDFVDHAATLVGEWISAPEKHQQACEMARSRAEALSQESKSYFHRFLEEIRQVS